VSPPRPEHLALEGAAGSLEVVVEDPAAAGDHYAVVCHPHPLYGGTMDNKVVTSLARALHECAVPTLRFNFRGVGSSAGTHDEGRGESDDAVALADYGATRWAGKTLIAAGFSFGGMVALRLAQRRRAAHLIAVAPAVTRFEGEPGPRPDCPITVIQGDADDVIDPKAVIGWAEALSPPPRLVLLRGVGHFFHGRLAELRDAVVAAIRNG
jgi:alpha/beta superfamily hydrolase